MTALPSPAPQRGGIDLPSVSASRPDLPAFAAGGPGPKASDIELPSPRAARPQGAPFDSDLPELADIDLADPQAPPPAPSHPMELELPSVGERLAPGAGLPAPAADWPDLSGDLPALGGDLPALGGDLPALGGDLPAPGGSLPAVAGELPTLGGELPSIGGNLPSIGGNLPAAGGGLPARKPSDVPRPGAGESPSLPPALGGTFGSAPSTSTPGMAALDLDMGSLPPLQDAPRSGPAVIDLPPSDSLVPQPPSAPRPLPSPSGAGGFGEVDLLGGLPGGLGATAPMPSADSLEADPFGEAPLPGGGPATAPAPQRLAPSAGFTAPPAGGEVRRQMGGGGTDYGEVSLEGEGPGAEVVIDGPAPAPAPGGRSEDDMEFGAVPQEATGSSAQQVAAVPLKLAAQAPKRRWGLRLLAGAFVLGLGGAALALVPSVGPFGAFFIMDQLNAGQYHALVVSTAKAVNAALAQDTYPDARRAAHLVDQAQGQARRAKGVAALAAYVGFISELRFGTEAAVHARAGVLLDELADESDVEMLALARSARAAADGQIAKARQLLGQAESRGKSIESAVLRAELELRAKDAKAAVAAWEAARRYGDSPRVQYGLARARLAAGDEKAALAEAERVLKQHPKHVGARVLVARLSSGTREGEGRAVQLLESVIKDAPAASPEELVNAYTLLGLLHLGRSRISAAESAFAKALEINPKASRALVGLGDSLYRAGRYSEAQARYEAGTQADPDDLTAKIGVAKSKLALERVQEAAALLKKLREAQPQDPLVGYWYGRVQEALGARDAAQAAYRDVLKAAPADPRSADVYIALALLQNQQGRSDDAQKTLDSAKELMPNVPAVWSALGDVALSQGRYKEALAHFQRASSLDPQDLGAKFRIGTALRRDRQFEEAAKVFDEVAAVDKDYPGLALERGLLFEASGHSDEALKQYEDALAKAPNDPDLMLRVGCGKVAAGSAEQAEELLRKVLAQRPSSAETHHCLGRALLVQGTRLADALRMLERAVELDPNRAEYYLYVGWAANEAGNVPKAERALAEALKLDQGLADAYWQRGVLRQRQGAVRDAIADLTRALALRPSRHEAHAALADAYYDLGRESEAMKEWQMAIQAQPDNATWRFRYGKLLAANRINDQAVEQLTKALSLVENVEPPPRWRWEAHHALARALGSSPQAAQHWEQFLRLGPRDSPYRADAKAFLEKVGKPWTGD